MYALSGATKAGTLEVLYKGTVVVESVSVAVVVVVVEEEVASGEVGDWDGDGVKFSLTIWP